MNSIFSYINYRLLLKDYYEENKEKSKYFSYRYFSTKAGINSPSFLKQVIESRRNLTPVTLEKFLTALKFSDKEASFFRHLVFFNQAKTAKEKQQHYTIMLSMMQSVSKQRLTVLQHG